jgi:hypothetical protein
LWAHAAAHYTAILIFYPLWVLHCVYYFGGLDCVLASVLLCLRFVLCAFVFLFSFARILRGASFNVQAGISGERPSKSDISATAHLAAAGAGGEAWRAASNKGLSAAS